MDREVILRQSEAWSFVRSISDPTERLLAEVALANALSFLVTDPQGHASLSATPFDALTFVQAAHAFLRNRDVLRGILEGRIRSIDDLSPFP